MLAVVVALGSGRVVACPRAAVSSCCAESDDGARVERACCCLEPGDSVPARAADAGAPLRRPADDPGLPATVAAEGHGFDPPGESLQPRRQHHSSIPPPTLLAARTSFLC